MLMLWEKKDELSTVAERSKSCGDAAVACTVCRCSCERWCKMLSANASLRKKKRYFRGEQESEYQQRKQSQPYWFWFINYIQWKDLKKFGICEFERRKSIYTQIRTMYIFPGLLPRFVFKNVNILRWICDFSFLKLDLGNKLKLLEGNTQVKEKQLLQSQEWHEQNDRHLPKGQRKYQKYKKEEASPHETRWRMCTISR